MKSIDQMVITAMTTFLLMTHAHANSNSLDTSSPSSSSEKCFGIVKKGLNDCATAVSSCAGSSTKDRQADAFVFLPKGMCDRLVGGSLKAPIVKK